MPRLLRSRLLRTSCLLLCGSAFALVPITASADPTPAECDARVNDTPSKLVECIQTADLMACRQGRISNVRADEASRTRDQNPHSSSQARTTGGAERRPRLRHNFVRVARGSARLAFLSC